MQKRILGRQSIVLAVGCRLVFRGMLNGRYGMVVVRLCLKVCLGGTVGYKLELGAVGRAGFLGLHPGSSCGQSVARGMSVRPHESYLQDMSTVRMAWLLLLLRAKQSKEIVAVVGPGRRGTVVYLAGSCRGVQTIDSVRSGLHNFYIK